MQVMKQSQKVVGKASVGGPFELIDYDGRKFTDRYVRPPSSQRLPLALTIVLKQAAARGVCSSVLWLHLLP